MSISRRPVILGGKWNETMEEQTMKYGVIDVGGGLRGIYGAGVLGFAKAPAEKALRGIMRDNPAVSVEDLVRMALKIL